jgi:hypothetical protein
MKDSSEYRAESLAEWVVVATFGLADSARERIKLEIEAHHAEAAKALVQAGASQENAEASALLELGDPKAAAKSFRQRHLTVEEERDAAEDVHPETFYATLVNFCPASDQCDTFLHPVEQIRIPSLLHFVGNYKSGPHHRVFYFDPLV